MHRTFTDTRILAVFYSLISSSTTAVMPFTPVAIVGLGTGPTFHNVLSTAQVL